MPWTFKLSDSTTTVDLHDGTVTKVNLGGFHAPVGPSLMSFAGNNLSRHGADLVERTYGNRQISVDFQIIGSAIGTVVGRIQDINNLLRKAEEFAKTGFGNQVQLLYGWTNASSTVAFNILEGTLDLGQNLHTPYLSTGTLIRNARLQLTAEPFAMGTKETLENRLADPSFEIDSALADWANVNQAGSSNRSTTGSAKYGTAALILSIGTTGAVAGNQHIRQQEFAIPTNTTTPYVASVWVKADQATNCTFSLRISVRGTGGAQVSQGQSSLTGTNGSMQLLTTSATATGSGSVLYMVFFELTTATATGTYFVDGAYFRTGTSLPTAWISGRDVKNHFDDDGQAHINYVDVYDVPGDVPAVAQIQGDEVEAHTVFYVAARHNPRQTNTLWLEAETGTGTGGGSTSSKVAVADASNGSILRWAGSASLDFPTAAATPGTLNLAIGVPAQGLFRVITRAGRAQGTGPGSATSTTYLGVGYTYGSVTQLPTSTLDYLAFGTGTVATAIADLGLITIPPIVTPIDGTVGTFTLKVCWWAAGNINNSSLDLDWVMLLPADEGMVYGTKASNADRVLVDSRSRPKGIYLMTTGNVVQAFPQQQGQAPEIHPKGSRIYFITNGGTADVASGFTVTVAYVPRFLQMQ